MTLAALSGPAMGWNSWNTLRCRGLNEPTVVEMADALVTSGMRDAGYQYVVVDDCWQAHRRRPDGRLAAHPQRFPSGIEALAEEVHRRGLKLGLYLAPGRRTCAEIYDRYGERGGLGSFGHEELDLDTLLGWGVDYLKYDWCKAETGRTGLAEREVFARMSALIAAADREVVFSVSEYGRTRPWEWAPGLAHSWRTTGDISARWRRVLHNARRTARVSRSVRDSDLVGVNDPDLLEIGNGRLLGDVAWAHLAMWAMLGAPLMAGNDLRSMTDETRDVLTDPVLLALDQRRPRTGAQVRRGRTGVDLWWREDPEGPAWLVVNTVPASRQLDLAGLIGEPPRNTVLHSRSGVREWTESVHLGPRSAVLVTVCDRTPG